MATSNDAQQFDERAQENRLYISMSDAAEIGGFAEAVAAAISTIRGIDTTGFEAAAIFVPTPSGGGTPKIFGHPQERVGRDSD
jgi:hypothetical protein